MGTDIRATISTKNRYWVGKHRYYELKHFCLQYPEWKKNYASIDGLSNHSPTPIKIRKGNDANDPTAVYAEARLYFAQRIEMIEKTAKEAAGDVIGKLLLLSVTEELSYEHLNALYGVPCCKDAWYTIYRRFFWLLDKARK